MLRLPPVLVVFSLPNAILSILQDSKLSYQILIPKFLLACWIRMMEMSLAMSFVSVRASRLTLNKLHFRPTSPHQVLLSV